MVKRVFAVWGDESSESVEEVEENEDVSMMAIEDDESIINSIFSLMSRSDDEDHAPEVTLFELKDDLENLSTKSVRKLAALLIDSIDERSIEN